MTKNDIYVSVDTPKKAKKLKNLLDMFGEDVFSKPNHKNSGHNGTDYGWGYGFSNDQWQGFNTKSIVHNGKKFKKVSIKKLRNILAKQHLMEGDYVVCEDNFICRIDKVENNGIHFSNPFVGVYDISYFKRYATHDEIALLEPKQKELEIGKWYHLSWDGSWCLAPFKGKEVASYGFHSDEGWMYGVYWFGDYNINSLEKREATPQEVESALIEEAKRREFKNGFIARVKHADESESFWNGKDPERYIFKNNNLYYYSDIYPIFKDGKWAEIIEQEKFAELKEAIKNVEAVQFRREKNNYEWHDRWCNAPSWGNDPEYPIKPEEPVKVGDWMFNPKTKKITQVKKDNHGKSLIGSGWIKIKDAELVEKLNSL